MRFRVMLTIWVAKLFSVICLVSILWPGSISMVRCWRMLLLFDGIRDIVRVWLVCSLCGSKRFWRVRIDVSVSCGSLLACSSVFIRVLFVCTSKVLWIVSFGIGVNSIIGGGGSSVAVAKVLS